MIKCWCILELLYKRTREKYILHVHAKNYIKI